MTPQYIEITENGSKFYYKDKQMNILHREDGPAISYKDGDKLWYLNGQLHCEDGPAIEHCSGAKNWYKHGKRHREDGPAYEGVDGTKFWIVNGLFHREDGPAMEYGDGRKSWYLNNKKLTEQEFKMKTAKEIIWTMNEIAAKFGITIELSKDDWKEIQATLQGKREQTSSAIKEGTYCPEEWYVWNNPKGL